MASLSILTILLLTFTTSILSLPASAPQNPVGKVSYYQGTLSSSISTSPSDCGTWVSSGNLTEGLCKPLRTSGVSIAALVDRDCTFTLYKGTESCSGDIESKDSISIDKGGEGVCVPTGVLDGGVWQKASGVWTCGTVGKRVRRD